MSDKEKLSIFRALKLETPIEQIMDKMRINEKTLLLIHNEFESIKQLLQEVNSIEEISKQTKLKPDFLEKVRHIIETDPEKLKEESEDDDSAMRNTPEDDLKQLPNQKKERKKEKVAKDGLKNTEQKMQSSGNEETADVLIKDVGEIARSMAIDRQEIGKHAMESYGTVASQYGYTDLLEFMDHMFLFWIENQGKIREMEETIAEYEELITQLRGVVDTDIVQTSINQCIDRVLVAALMGGGNINVESLQAYREFLIGDPNTRNKLKMLAGQCNNTSSQQESNTVLNML